MLRPYPSCQSVKKNLHAWETGLSPLQFQVIQELGAESFSQNEFWDHKRKVSMRILYQECPCLLRFISLIWVRVGSVLLADR